MKKLLTTILLALVVLTGQAKEKAVVWEQPTIEYGNSNGDGFFNLALDVTKVELKDNETIVYITAQQRSDYPGAALYHHFCRWHRTQQVCTDKQGLQAGYGVPFPTVA